MNKGIIKQSCFLTLLRLTLTGMGVVASISPTFAASSHQQLTRTGNSISAAQGAKALIILLSQTSISQNSQIPKPPNSSAQNPFCYMVSPDGKVINLEALCGQAYPSRSNSSLNNANPNNANLSRPNLNVNQGSSPTQGNNVETP